MERNYSHDNDSTYEMTYSDDQSSQPETTYQNQYFDIMNYMPYSSQSHSITKYLACQIINRVYRNPKRYLISVPESMRIYEPVIVSTFNKLKAGNSTRGEDSLIKDYSNVLSKLSNHWPFHCIMNAVIKEIKDQFARKEYGKIKHVEEYEFAINILYRASESAIHT